MNGDGSALADRVRALLTAHSTREVPMFGGLSFMVDEKMVVSVRPGAELLAHVDPERSPHLVTLPGARPAEMGAGRAMGPGWISVSADVIEDNERLAFWVGEAVEYVGNR